MPEIKVRFVSPGDPVKKPKMRADQKHFPQAGMALEIWGVSLFGYERREYVDRETGKKVASPKSGADAVGVEMRTKREFHKSRDISDMKYWKSLYVRSFKVLQASIFRSVGTVDKTHRKAIEDELDRALSRLNSAEGKDAIHEQVIASLFRLVFLLLGRSAYAVPGKRRNFATFRTLTYSQTEEQLSWLLQGYIQGNPAEHGFEDHFAADYAFHQWARANKRLASERATYVDWVRAVHPETYGKFV